MLDGTHVKTGGPDPLDYSHKTKKGARNWIVAIDRADTRIIFYQGNWPATYHDS